MNILELVAIAAFIGLIFIWRWSQRALKAQLALEEAFTNAKIAEEKGKWRRKIQAREAALQPPSKN